MEGRLFAIGDIHGCVRELEALLAGLRLARGDTLAFVGDYIDRGPDPRAVIDLLLDVQRRPGITTVFLKGNHEDMCLEYLGRPGHWGESWMLNGGAVTLRSYGLDARVSGDEAVARIPPAHLRFLESLEMKHLADSYLLVHAGIRPGVPLAAQDEEDLLWIREEFILAPHDLPHTVIFGHTPHREPVVDLPYKLGIDTGCVYGGALTCVELPTGTLHQVRFGERQVRRRPLATVARPRT